MDNDGMNSVTLFHSMMNYPILATKNLFVVIIRGTVFWVWNEHNVWSP